MKLPAQIKIKEVGLREGLQVCSKVIALSDKLELVRLLNKTGVKDIELTAYVRSDRVPQMADAEQLVAQYERIAGVSYTALCLNVKGLEKAVASGRLDNRGWIYASASETFLKKNNNLSFADFYASLKDWSAALHKYALPLQGIMISNAFGCSYEGSIDVKQVIKMLKQVGQQLSDLGMEFDEIALADTVGLANPKSIERLVSECFAKFPGKHVSLHLHDTRGLGIANAWAGILAGVTIFESSVAGVGGCPFTKGAAGNIATEDLLYLCSQVGIQTGLDLEQYCSLARSLEVLLGSEALNGRYYRSTVVNI